MYNYYNRHYYVTIYTQIGMVAWQMTLKTPECPEGRDIIVISNDITHKIGSFGPTKDLLFKGRHHSKLTWYKCYS